MNQDGPVSDSNLGAKSGSELVLVSVPIGNQEDLSERAKQTLSGADLIIGEEARVVAPLLKKIGVQKEFLLLNEHTDSAGLQILLSEVFRHNVTVLVCDSGTPGIEDPGRDLVKAVLNRGGKVRSVPGPAALVVALSISGFVTSPFTFGGFLSRDSAERKRQIKDYLRLGHALVFYETPYRYKAVLHDLAEVLRELSEERKIFLGLDLTSEDEIQIRGSAKEVLAKVEELPKKNPVIVISEKQAFPATSIRSKPKHRREKR
ncbi:hypothetical protein CH373_03990 [Leptospira perolatii]|uniref:Tetrapyrrole methylase domain-containing protein n=1 Tax=Leptospira perolatii TaxID=2023191 RepID=A0A2M9ZPX9_9LEPT|nr:SAM-dependent methyltransferase [Leptospira perolatii]PJZ69037.1 hypothetical protein CH360_13340 [Leptospira perolatii]PJZ74094.1 hypothetical protein CH373_03990 [Leptospira perolatii]